MIELEYPSRKFVKSVEAVCSSHQNFAVRVRKGTKANEIIRRKLPRWFDGLPYPGGKIKDIVDTWRILGFYQAVAVAKVNSGYAMSYEDNEDLVVEFKKTTSGVFDA